MIRTDSTKVHDELDFAAVRRIYEAADLPKELAGHIVASPFHLYSVEALRDKHELRRPTGSPVDVFVFGEGEPTKRHVTKIGGLPYWPAEKPWPTNADGSPFWFLAQLNFADSLDLLPRLPGDLLVILTEDEESWLWDDQETVHFEWQTVKNEQLITSQQFPAFEHEYEYVDCYGVIHRTEDYPESAEVANELDVGESYNLAVLNATKIGGAPNFIQGDQGIPGIFLAQLASIQPAPRVSFPWVNREEPYDLGFDKNGIYGNQQMIGDMGSLYLFLQEDGSIRCTTQCY
jgi:uncharacterized protein YwqG